MKKLMIMVALIAGMANATQAQGFRMIVHVAPTAFEVSSDENTILLSGSEKGVSYQLIQVNTENGKSVEVSVGETVEGTGKSITFPILSAEGKFKVRGYRTDNSGCITEMKGLVSVEKPKVEPKASKITIDLNDSSQQEVYCFPGIDTIVMIKPRAEIFDPLMGTGKSLTFNDPNAQVIVPTSKSSTSVGDEGESQVQNYVIAAFFFLVFLALLFGICNRRKLVSGSHTEIKLPCTGTVYPPRTHKKN